MRRLRVVAGVIIAGGRVLAAQRPEHKDLAGAWELPGGKVEPGESDAAALARELREELDVDVAVGDLVAEAEHRYPDKIVLGQSAGAQATLDSGVVRGKALQVHGHANALTPPEVKQAAYRAMCDYAAAGRLTVEYEEIPLDDVAEAWERQAASPHVKLILVP
jgi:8-oxo-dGTP pyrophosphatase MutT (NUDIX family)